MRFSISQEVFEHFTGLSVGVIIAQETDNTGKSEELDKLLSEMVELVRINYNPTDFSNNNLISPWKSAYFDYEKKPHKIHSSVEKYTKEVIEKGDIRRINKLKDISKFISLKHTVPVECFDTRKIDGYLSLERAKGDEHFFEDRKIVNPEKGEFIYKTSTVVLARKLDYVESRKGAVDENTKSAIILIEGLKPLLKTKIEEISKDASDLVQGFCNAKVNFLILDKDNPSIEF